MGGLRRLRRMPRHRVLYPYSAKDYGYERFQALVEDTRARGLEYNDNRVARNEAAGEKGLAVEKYEKKPANAHYGISGPTQQSESVGALRFILQWVNLDLDQFSTTLEKGTYGFRIAGVHIFRTNSSPKAETGGYDQISTSLFYALAQNDGILSDIATPMDQGEGRGIYWRPHCEELKKRSREALGHVQIRNRSSWGNEYFQVAPRSAINPKAHSEAPEPQTKAK